MHTDSILRLRDEPEAVCREYLASLYADLFRENDAFHERFDQMKQMLPPDEFAEWAREEYRRLRSNTAPIMHQIESLVEALARVEAFRIPAPFIVETAIS